MEAIQSGKSEKKHRASTSGAKADKKKAHQKKKKGLSNERHNPKAFSVSNIVRTKRTQQRNLDRGQKKEVVPLRDRTEDLPPPTMVCVMGPTGCGKSTLIRSLVKIYTGQNLGNAKGPITVIAGRKKRITFFECPLDLPSMTDMAKVADLVVLMIDASYGFEMETFEFLNLLQLHGMPKVVGVLSHLDAFKQNKLLQNTKKALKNRFWTEIYKGAKLFDLSGIVNGKYLKHEVKRLSLYIGRVKFRPLVWRNTHPFVVVDRVEEISSTGARETDDTKDVALCGYVRGTHLKPNTMVHLVGAGDFQMDSIELLEDPCPMPGKGKENTTLKVKDSLLYAPMANVGRMQIDKDGGVYINVKNVNYTKPELLRMQEGEEMPSYQDSQNGPAALLRELQDAPGLSSQIKSTEMSLFAGGEKVRSGAALDEEESEDDDDGDEMEEEDNQGSTDEDSEEEESGSDENGGSDEEDDDEEEEAGLLQGEDNYDDEDEEGKEVDEDDDSSSDDGSGSESDTAVRVRGGRTGTVPRRRRAEETPAPSLMELVYGHNWAQDDKDGNRKQPDDSASDDDEDEDELFVPKKEADKNKYLNANALDSSRRQPAVRLPAPKATANAGIADDSENNGEDEDEDEDGDGDGESDPMQQLCDLVRNKFVTSKEGWARVNGQGQTMSGAESGTGGDGDGSDDDNEDEGFDDFEDLEGGASSSEPSAAKRSRNDDSDSEDDSDSDEEEDEEKSNLAIDEQLRAMNAKNKAAAKKNFDSAYDNKKLSGDGDGDGDEEGEGGKKTSEEEEEEKYLEAAQRIQEDLRERNRVEFGDDGEHSRLKLEGYRQGLYVRIVFRGVPSEFIHLFNSSKPCIIGGLLPHEMAMGFVRARVKRHRWHKRILKTNDPLIFSVGWRRFQSMPVYAIEDTNDRQRFLKYTPEHMHCIATFYGPLVPPNTGILAFQSTSDKTVNFRISLTGASLELQAKTNVVKKLKLVGTPSKVFKNTAFIEGMFNSAMEVSRFTGAKIKTVSGIRGSIKRPLKEGQPGSFRAAFEDKILMSDIIICRLWVPVELKEWYSPLTNLIDKDWKGLRTVAQIRREDKVAQETNKDSLYSNPIERKERVFKKLSIPKKLQESLPFSSKPKQQAKAKRNSYVQRRQVVLEPEEKKQRAAVQMIQTLKNDKMGKRREAGKARLEKKTKEREKHAEQFEAKAKEEKKRKHMIAGKEEARKKAKAETGRR